MVNSCHRILLFEKNDIAELGWSLKVICLKKKKTENASVELLVKSRG